jgi:hypothetical protein
MRSDEVRRRISPGGRGGELENTFSEIIEELRNADSTLQSTGIMEYWRIVDGSCDFTNSVRFRSAA